LQANAGTPADKLSYTIVQDIAVDGAFNEAVKSDPPFEAVIHTASPFFFGHTDPVKDILDPAVKGTTGVLKAIQAFAPTVKRVVITSSFAAIVNGKQHPAVYSEELWNPITMEEAMQPAGTYRASKTFAERAAWDFVKDNKPNFTVATINPPMVFGPVANDQSLASINTSNARILDAIQGKHKDSIPPTGVYLWVDVREVALAHVLAMEKEEAQGNRFFLCAGHFSNKAISDVLRKNFPELAPELPSADVPDDVPADVYQADNSKSRNVLGITYRTFEESIKDTARTLLDLGAGK